MPILSNHDHVLKCRLRRCNNYNLNLEHDFSLVLTKTRYSCVVACVGYPRCKDTITIFGLRD